MPFTKKNAARFGRKGAASRHGGASKRLERRHFGGKTPRKLQADQVARLERSGLSRSRSIRAVRENARIFGVTYVGPKR